MSKGIEHENLNSKSFAIKIIARYKKVNVAENPYRTIIWAAFKKHKERLKSSISSTCRLLLNVFQSNKKKSYFDMEFG